MYLLRPDYQATSNSWTFLEVNVGIICACLPVLKAPITKFVPFMRDKNFRPSQYAEQFSKDWHTSPNAITHVTRNRADNDSDEEFILQDRAVRKTTDINIAYEEASGKSESDIVHPSSEMKREDKLG